MRDWLRVLEDFTSHQDYGWFLAALGWIAVGVVAWRRRDQQRQHPAEAWLGWLAAAGVLNAGAEFWFSTRNEAQPYIGLDLFLGAVAAQGAVALWWPAAAWLPRVRPVVWRVAMGLAGLALAAGRVLDPVYGGWALSLLAVGGAGCTVRALRDGKVLPGLAATIRGRLEAGMLLAAIWTIVATFGPLAYLLLEGRRDTDLGHFALPAALLHATAAGLLAWALWAERLQAVALTSDYAARNLRTDLRMGLAGLGAWLALGLGFSIYSGQKARADYEDGLKARAGTIAAMLDETIVRSAFGVDFNARGTTRANDPSGRTVEFVYVDEQTLGALEKLGRQMVRLRRENRDVNSLWLVYRGRTRLFAAVDDRTALLGQRGRVVLRYLTADDFRNFGTKRPFIEGPIREIWNSRLMVYAPLYATAEPTGIRAWVLLAVSGTRWAVTFAQARLQSIAVTAIGVGLWVLAMGYRLRRTEREQALQRAEQALAADRAKSEFLAQVSHELRTPLQGVLGFSEMLAKSSLTEPHRALVSAVRSQGALMLRLVNDLIDLGALQSGAFRLHLEPVDLRALARECVESVRPKAAAKGLALEEDFHAGAPAFVQADGARLRQVLLNLLGNAVKFTQEGRVTLTVRRGEPPAPEPVTVPPDETFAGVWVEFRVADTGPGIDPEDQPRIFQPFTRLETGTQTEGAGIGLALVARLCSAMKGRVRVESDGEHGTTFIVRLPLLPSAEPAAGPPVAALDRAWQGLRVLVADDNTVMRELLGAFFREHGAAVTAVEDGLAAVEAAQAGEFDVVLLDGAMPWLDGYATARRLREAGGAVGRPWIIGLSAQAWATDEARGLAEGMDRFLTKPVGMDVLARAVAESPAAAGRSAVTAADAVDAALRQRLLIQYEKETPGIVARMVEAAHGKDWASLYRLAHYLKNSADALGARRLQHFCRELQLAAEAADETRIEPLLSVVKISWRDPGRPGENVTAP